ncbi:MAG: sigma-70 family RNA polymerase sigma factor [Clostridia bacterium]|jgi:RNA polymerase sigma factor, sigma-70 family|nr:sigma-70 family RNA polymerase sigma factor [Clostridium sp.]MEE0127473.1 sigma-70 family RNA polymerase sigma factor [Clostridia bacterium]HJJ13139.1 sigma-70 family RNA polymerase sigma factor [Clostridiaceae bacterium]
MYENTVGEILKAQNDKEELGRIVENNSGLVWSIVKRFTGRGYENEDLYQIGTIGLIKAIKNFNPEYEVKLSTYAVTYIIGEIKKFIRDDGIIKVSRSIKELCVKIKDIENRNIKEGKNVTIEEIARELKVEKEDIALAIDSMKQVESIYQEESNDGKISIIDKISSEKDETEITVNKIFIKELLNKMDSRDRQIIMLRYFNGQTQSQVAKMLNISQVQVSRIEKKILNKMKIELIS